MVFTCGVGAAQAEEGQEEAGGNFPHGHVKLILISSVVPAPVSPQRDSGYLRTGELVPNPNPHGSVEISRSSIKRSASSRRLSYGSGPGGQKHSDILSRS